MDDPVRIAREQALCDQQNYNSTPPPGPHCPGVFDQWLCWPHTRVGATVLRPCPVFVPGFSEDLFAHKECTDNGSWWRHPDTGRPWSNYTTCIKPEDDVSDIILVYEIGYSVSLLALVTSLAILLYFRSLRCARITVHMHLFSSFGLHNCWWLVWYSRVVRAPPVLAASPAWCRLLAAGLAYSTLTTYAWMLCEGIYLHTVLVHAFVSERRLVRVLSVCGWGLPLLPGLLLVGRRLAAGAALCWLEEAPAPEVAAPAVAAVLVNVVFLVNIVRVLCTKLRAGAPRAASSTALHALRATCLLAPLLGVQFLLTPFRPPREARYWLLYEYVSALAASLQGLLVAALYCFCNGEVLAQLRRRWRALLFRPRANSTTNTTVSFVRSGNEDKL